MNKLERVMQFTFRQDKECIMPVTTSNTYGKISISDEAIAKVAAHAALECYGIVEMVPRTFMDSFSQLLKKETGGKGVKVVTSGDRIYIDIFVIIKFAQKSRKIQGGAVHGNDRGYGQRQHTRRKTLSRVFMAAFFVFGGIFFKCKKQ